MADTQIQPLHPQHTPADPIHSISPEKGPSTQQIIALITLLPLGGILLTLCGLTLAAAVTGLAVATPVFILFSPIIVPAVLTVGLSATAVLASGAFGLAGMHSVMGILKHLPQVVGKIVGQLGGKVQEAPEYVEVAKRGMQEQEGTGQVGHRMKDTGEQVQKKSS